MNIAKMKFMKMKIVKNEIREIQICTKKSPKFLASICWGGKFKSAQKIPKISSFHMLGGKFKSAPKNPEFF